MKDKKRFLSLKNTGTAELYRNKMRQRNKNMKGEAYF